MFDHTSNVTVAQWGVVLGASLAAAVLDLRGRKIPNALTVPIALAGLVYGLVAGGLSELGVAFAAMLVVMAPYVLLFVFAGGGAGDAKMMGAIGAWLGLEAGVVVLLAVLLTGALFGVAKIVAVRQIRPAFGRIGAAFYVMFVALCSGRKGWAMIKPDPERAEEPVDPRLAMAYGPAIFIGVCITAIWVNIWQA